MVWSIFQYENSFIETTKEEINGIPSLKFKPKGFTGLLPTVIYYHGWHSSKGFKRFEAITIATHGYQVIVPDALHHGDRDPIDHDDPTNLHKYLWKIINQSIEESTDYIETIIKEHGADPERIGIMGNSMGAITAGGIFVKNPHLKCLVGLNGTFAWQEAINLHQFPPTKEYKELIESYDPMAKEEVIKDRPIIILHGDQDSTLAIDTQKLFYEKMKPLYKDKNKIQLIEAYKVNHHVTTGMFERVIMWFKEYL